MLSVVLTIKSKLLNVTYPLMATVLVEGVKVYVLINFLAIFYVYIFYYPPKTSANAKAVGLFKLPL